MVELRGVDSAGVPICAKWSLLAKNDHGPYIPILPAAACLKKLMGLELENGAGLAAEHLSLDSILEQMEPYAISTQYEVGKAA